MASPNSPKAIQFGEAMILRETRRERSLITRDLEEVESELAEVLEKVKELRSRRNGLLKQQKEVPKKWGILQKSINILKKPNTKMSSAEYEELHDQHRRIISEYTGTKTFL